MLKLKLQYFGHLMQRTDSFVKTLMLGKIEGRKSIGSGFNLFVTERKGMPLGVLTQPGGPHQQRIAYVSRELDVISCR